MATETYHNGIHSLMDVFKNAQSQLIVNICMELGQPEKSEGLISKFIDSKIKLKKFKDKNAPKNPSTGYQLFCNERRKILKEKNKDISFRDLMQTLSADWKAISQEEKDKYLALSEKDKERFVEENEKYKMALFSSTLSNA